ncbi:ribosomal protein S18-alanine N-acetyltransferase [Paenalcaligenes niemegkensis]|uniref:ribosomal protein S18-alanine N-acetyltransferase n=1 Tax=Paenalcaligenes niemegkensis TaxID=2895469 RepID=UPI001EE7F962|nr:ribosomal protein S18-alanine N-acetyltransferase [Paenalcaligenes niemegkensis]MCQ9616916.1 ribosomal protein S18-alanine N-acetyltransferase [Paenalcaligenes niemegkensis]
MMNTLKDQMEIVIRDMKAADIVTVAAIEAKVQPEQPWSEANFRDSYMSCYTMLVAEVNQQIVGYVVVLIAPDLGELLLIGVEPGYQSKGVGKALLNAIEHVLLSKGLDALMLEVRDSNLQARRFYETQGFISVGLRKNYYQCGESQREDALLLQKTLSQGAL